MHARRSTFLLLALVLLLALLVVSGARPYDRATWLMEVFPIFIAVAVLLCTYKRFPLTTLLYVSILLHALVLMLGGAYTYARVPLGFQIADYFDLARNPYDKIGHFFQGFVPALVAREILVRGAYVLGRKMLVFHVICIVLAISACYEFIEWGAALLMGQGADEFLGTQGDPWDTQSDMFFALIGAVCALLLLSGEQDRQIRRLTSAALRETAPDVSASTGRRHCSAETVGKLASGEERRRPETGSDP
ncbi:MAG: putative membrane protein [Candidatus Accumulibacter regalis]|jgi:Predicted membrane protein